MQVNSIKDTSFGSTYRIPIFEPGITDAKRAALKVLVSRYQNYRFPEGNNGCAKLSIRKKLDEGFEQKLRQIGFKVYQKFEKNNLPKTDNRMDKYISINYARGNYQQFGKQRV